MLAEALEVELGDLLPEDEINTAYNKDTNKWLAFLHISGFFTLLIPPIIIWIWEKNEIAEINKHAVDVINFQISMWIYLFSTGFLVMLVIGIPILIFLGIFSSFVVVINTLKVLNGNTYRYPLSLNILKNL